MRAGIPIREEEDIMRHCVVFVTALLLSLGLSPADAQQARQVGTVYRDCPSCPEMVVIGPGSFTMGEVGHTRRTPLHKVTIGYSFAVGRYDVTFDEWDACVADGGCSGYRPDDHGWGRGRRPVINVSWDDAQGYVGVARQKDGQALPADQRGRVGIRRAQLGRRRHSGGATISAEATPTAVAAAASGTRCRPLRSAASSQMPLASTILPAT